MEHARRDQPEAHLTRDGSTIRGWATMKGDAGE
jgi:hypothetical protein